MPGMGDARFENAVVYICAHSEEGAMGLIVNRQADTLMFSDLLDQLDIAPGPGSKDVAIYVGGPVETGRGFVLHSPDYISEGSTMQVDARFAMTGTRDILRDIAGGGGPTDKLLCLGYAGWGPGQLEDEISQNGWLTAAASTELVFAKADAVKWEAALLSIGVPPAMLSGEAGHA